MIVLADFALARSVLVELLGHVSGDRDEHSLRALHQQVARFLGESDDVHPLCQRVVTRPSVPMAPPSLPRCGRSPSALFRAARTLAVLLRSVRGTRRGALWGTRSVVPSWPWLVLRKKGRGRSPRSGVQPECFSATAIEARLRSIPVPRRSGAVPRVRSSNSIMLLRGRVFTDRGNYAFIACPASIPNSGFERSAAASGGFGRSIARCSVSLRRRRPVMSGLALQRVDSSATAARRRPSPGEVSSSARLARIMREGVVLGETQGPPCGTNVVYTNV